MELIIRDEKVTILLQKKLRNNLNTQSNISSLVSPKTHFIFKK